MQMRNKGFIPYLGSIVLLILNVPIYLHGQKNYIRIYTLTEECSPGTSLSMKNSLIESNYYDAAGRFVQNVKQGITPEGNDMANYVVYDGLSQKVKEWASIPLNESDGEYKPLRTVELSSYSGNHYVNYKYELSSWHRVVNEMDINSFNKGVKREYLFNVNNIPELSVVNIMADDCDYLKKEGNYVDGALACVKITDEEGNVLYNFYDWRQRLILERRINASQPVDTYFIYNKWGQLVMVLPPALYGQIQNLTLKVDYETANSRYEFHKFAYLYKYDKYGRCTGKKLPGADWYYIIFDGDHRPVFEQTGNQRKKGEWSFRKYDGLGRVILEGTVQESHYSILVAEYMDKLVKEDFIGGDGKAFGYSSNINYRRPSQIKKVYYYDSYDFLSLPAFENKFTGNTESSVIKSTTLLTGTYIAGLEDPDKYELSAFYYDYRGRLKKSESNNMVTNVKTKYITNTTLPTR